VLRAIMDISAPAISLPRTGLNAWIDAIEEAARQDWYEPLRNVLKNSFDSAGEELWLIASHKSKQPFAAWEPFFVHPLRELLIPVLRHRTVVPGSYATPVVLGRVAGNFAATAALLSTRFPIGLRGEGSRPETYLFTAAT
jgi:hypothetical protein